MTSNKPYFIRAIYEWIADNSMTPYIIINITDQPHITVPLQHVDKTGQIILNISETAANNLLINNDHISFNARFSGKGMKIYAPIGAITAIYARETGEGMVFEPEIHTEGHDADAPPTLTLVKD